MWFRFASRAAGLRLAALALSTLPLAGCGLFDDLFGRDTGKCPTAEIAGTLGSVTRFRGDPGNPANLAYRATLSNIQSDCSFGDDSVTVTVNVTVMAEIGPAATERSAEFPYFLAVATPGDRVVAKRQFGGALNFGTTQRRTGVTDTLTETIPLKDLKQSDRYHLMLGFQLTPDELAYNRARGRGGE